MCGCQKPVIQQPAPQAPATPEPAREPVKASK